MRQRPKPGPGIESHRTDDLGAEIGALQLDFSGGAIPVVNVKSVPHLSPFRYPGGKTWLVPTVCKWLTSLPRHPKEFIEPFAGGANVGLTVASQKLAAHVTLVEIEDGVAAVWETILGGDAERLARNVFEFNLSPESVETVLESRPRSTIGLAFQTILRNRVQRGGILAPGAGRLKKGENGRGLRSRWYPSTLRSRILSIAAVRNRITFIHGDGLKFIKRSATRANAVYFIDPPYTASSNGAGSRLYCHFDIDHNKLFDLVGTLTGPFLMTYDDVPEVRALARAHGFQVQAVLMKSTHHLQKQELLISRDLGWLDTRN